MVDDPNNEAQDVIRSSRLAIAAAVTTISLAVGWFLVSWVVWHSPVIDAVGEAFGGVALVLVIVSIIGSLLRTR